MPRIKKFNKKVSYPKPSEINRNKKDQVMRLLGTKDVTFADYKYWNSLINKLTEIANLYGFNRLETPVIENFGLYKRYPRPEEMYYFSLGRGDKIALRPDLTHGLVRSYLEQEIDTTRPIKVFALGPVFRQEQKLQTGCYRQFTQFNLEILGEPKAVGEALMISIIYNLFKELQIDVQIQINSVGTFDCQKEYISKLAKYYRERGRKAKFCLNCKKNLLKNPIALLNCEEPACRAIRAEAPQINSFLSEESNVAFTRVLEYMDELGINYNFDPYLINRANYYTETIFEVWPLDEKGEIDGKLSLGRGGRYNKLIEQLGGQETAALGFSGGLERTVSKMKEKNLLFKKDDNIIFIAQVSDSGRLRAMTLFSELAKAGYKVRQAFTFDDLKEQLEEAKKLEAKIILILGKKEVNNETILFRDVEVGVQEVVTQKDLKERLTKSFNQK
jgi:histidyl-tRNA synthetase